MTTRNVRIHRQAIYQNKVTRRSTSTTLTSFISLVGHLNLLLQWFNSNPEPLWHLIIQFEQHKGTPSSLQSKVQLKQQTCPDILDFVLLSTESYSFLPRDGVRCRPIKSRDTFSANENYFTLEFYIKIILVK